MKIGISGGKMTVFLYKTRSFWSSTRFSTKVPLLHKKSVKNKVDSLFKSRHKVTTKINWLGISCKLSRISSDFEIFKKNFCLQVFKNRKALLMRSAFVNASKITPFIIYGYGRTPLIAIFAKHMLNFGSCLCLTPLDSRHLRVSPKVNPVKLTFLVESDIFSKPADFLVPKIIGYFYLRHFENGL